VNSGAKQRQDGQEKGEMCSSVADRPESLQHFRVLSPLTETVRLVDLQFLILCLAGLYPVYYLPFFSFPDNKQNSKIEEIPRWRLEGGSRKRASYSEILERRWRHTLQA
jgi:hypothetical protein